MTTSRPRSRARRMEEALEEDLGPGRVWTTAGANIQVAPFNSVQYSFGFSKTAPSDDLEDILELERRMYEVCERRVDQRMRKMLNFAQSLRTEYGLTDD